ncbi:MAG: hypothetical protein ACO3N1_08865 [Ilumatobacteraceae bacterium]|jgi:hypothetical protein
MTTPTTTYDISISAKAYDAMFDPNGTEAHVPVEKGGCGLPFPEWEKRGRGYTARWTGLTPDELDRVMTRLETGIMFCEADEAVTRREGEACRKALAAVEEQTGVRHHRIIF